MKGIDCLPNRFFELTFASLSNNPHRNRLFGYKEERRDRAQRNSGNHLKQKRCQYPAGNGIIIETK